MNLEHATNIATLSPHQKYELKRIRWRCRSGMLELDLLLKRFIDRAYFQLDHQQREQFEHLLALGDVTLLEWLVLGHSADHTDFKELVQLIRCILSE